MSIAKARASAEAKELFTSEAAAVAARAESGAKRREGFSFSEEEVLLLEQLFNTLYRGGDPKVLIRGKIASELARKFNVRAARIRSGKASKLEGAA